MGTYVSTNILMHFSDKDVFDEVVKIMGVELDFTGVNYSVYDRIEFQIYHEIYRKIGVSLDDYANNYDNLNVDVIHGYNSLGDLKKYAPVYDDIPQIDLENQTIFLSYHSKSNTHYNTCESILDVMADQFIRYSCDEDGYSRLTHSENMTGLEPYINSFSDVVDLKNMKILKSYNDEYYPWGYSV